MIDVNKLFIVATWKFENIEEILENKNFILDGNIYKIALFLKKQNLSENKLLILSNNNWNCIEVENLLEEASSKELENYMLVQKKEWDLLEFENEINNQLFTYINKKSQKIKKEIQIDDFLNE
jgi:hypothetical protein